MKQKKYSKEKRIESRSGAYSEENTPVQGICIGPDHIIVYDREGEITHEGTLSDWILKLDPQGSNLMNFKQRGIVK